MLEQRRYIIMPKLNKVSYRDDGFAEAQWAPAPILPLVLRLVITQSVILQHNPAILPAMDVVCPL